MSENMVNLLCGGEWIKSQASRSSCVHNPSNGTVIARTPLCDVAESRRAVEGALQAFPQWRSTPIVERARAMFRFRELIDAQSRQLAELITRENGKTLAESRAEIQRGLEMVEFACGVPSLFMGQTMPNIAEGVDGETMRHPVGVCVGITPFNFPSMVPLWMFPIAVVCGNTFVLKPSEKVPLSAIRLGELMHEAGFPDGVFNIVHGDGECVDALLTDPDVAAVSFVGSTHTAKHVYETATRHGKRVQAAGGAKNHLVVMPDADKDLVVKALAASAFGCAGQRCMAGSVAVMVGGSMSPVVDQLCEYSGRLVVGPTERDPTVDVGPLVSMEAVRRVDAYLHTAVEEGAQIALDGRRDGAQEGFLIGPSVVDRVEPDMKLAQDEIFGPVLSIIHTDDLDAAIAVGDRSRFGNGASIFTRDGRAAREFKHRFNAGMIGINVGVPAPMAWLPFTGWNQSFFGDLHIQGTEGVEFYTRQKMSLTRWFESANDEHHDPVWQTKEK